MEGVPSFEELAANPGKAAGLSRETLCALLRATRVLAAELEYLVTVAPAPSAPATTTDGQVEDRRLTLKEAAAYLGVTPRWLRSHAVPGKIRHGRYIVYDQRALHRYQQRRATQ